MDKSRLGSDDRFIFIPEIVDLICEEVYSVRHGLKTLSRLARTCRFFHESALDYLWKEITGIHILIKCMPQDLWNDTLLGQERTMVSHSLCRKKISNLTRVPPKATHSGYNSLGLDSSYDLRSPHQIIPNFRLLVIHFRKHFTDVSCSGRPTGNKHPLTKHQEVALEAPKG